MATIKSYTDINQSKKLKGILPTETADGYWFKGFPPQPYMVYTKGTPNPGEHIPCWSLAALVGVIPQEIFDGEYVINITEGCNNRWVLTYDHCDNRHYSHNKLSSGTDNLVDACYEMIIKLYELKML